jgi:large conductance mechanosensitive channel
LFINAFIAFVIVSFALFLIVKGISRLKKKEESKPSSGPTEIELLTQIRDSLKSK